MGGLFKVLVLTALMLCSTLAQDYTSTGRCSDFTVCSYSYSSKQVHFDGEETQSYNFSAEVDLSCRSTGTFGSKSATMYCLKVRNVVTDSQLLNDPVNETVDANEPEEPIEELQKLINTTVEDDGSGHTRFISGAPSVSQQLFDWGFCFVRTGDGRIADVIYSAKENPQVVNIKKGIVSAFQANFGNDLSREETDVSGSHRATYSFKTSESRTAMSFSRLVKSSDVHSLAGVPSGMMLRIYERRDEVSYDMNILQHATGSTKVVLSSLAEQSSRSKRDVFSSRRQETLDPDAASYDDTVTLDNDFKGDGTYTLERIKCTSLRDPLSRIHRSVDQLYFDESNLVKDSIVARIDPVAVDQGRMSRMRRSLPSIPAALERLHKDPQQYKLANSIHDLISLESEHGPLRRHTPVAHEVLSYLEKIANGKEKNDEEMRKLIYSMLAPEGGEHVQKKLMDILERLDLGGERNALQTYLAFLRNASLETAKRLDKLAKKNNDPLLLVLGSLAEFANEEVSRDVVRRLAKRINSVDSTDIDVIIHLIHALGNTGSHYAVKTLIYYLYHEDIDVQVAAIEALRMHTSDPAVQSAFILLLKGTYQEEIVESIAQTLLAGINDHSVHPEDKGDSGELSMALVAASLQSNNSKLHGLVKTYLRKVGTKEAIKLIEVLMEYATSDPTMDKFEYDIEDQISNNTKVSRHRRGSDWDAYNTDYDIVASYSSRRSDVRTYPSHKAYIWGKKFGVSKVYAYFGAGGFVGASNNGRKYKIFAKGVAKGHAFGKTATAVHAEYLRRRSYSSVYQKIYVKIVGKTLKNEAGYVPLACLEKTYNLYQSQKIRLFSFKFSVFIYVGTLNFYVSLHVKLSVKVRFCACEHYYTACATLIPQIALIPSAGASATILLTVRGGIEVSGNFEYQLEPEVCLKIDFQPSIRIKPCISVYHSWPNSYVEIYTYYQLRKFKSKWPPWKSYFYWDSKKRWSALSTRWDLPYTGRRVLWSSCSGSVVCNPNLPPPISPTTRPTTRPTIRIRTPWIWTPTTRPTIRTLPPRIWTPVTRTSLVQTISPFVHRVPYVRSRLG